MGQKSEQERVKTLVKETITLLCKNGLTYNAEFTIEALIGITLDKDNVMLMSISEIVKSDQCNISDCTDLSDENQHENLPNSSGVNHQRKRKRRKSKRHDTNGSITNNDQMVGTPGVDSCVKSESPVAIQYSKDESTNSEVVFVKEEVGSWQPCTQQVDISSNQGTSHNLLPDLTSALVTEVSQQGIGSDMEHHDVDSWADHALCNVGSYHKRLKTSIMQNSTVAAEHTLPQKTTYQYASKHVAVGSTFDSRVDRSQQSEASEPSWCFAGNPNLYTCDICGRYYRIKEHLLRHQKSHDSTLIMCKKCTQYFQTQELYEKHVEEKHGDLAKKHMCTLCEKRFTRAQHLENHMTRHNDGTILYNPL